ncbi:MAG: nucleotidyltransferase domain-containing protein [Candidatus Omnitrophica bacterium]|nr:nucleotidyltransferase domain-containing protein [Candidatus Omnitrophota bacterium]
MNRILKKIVKGLLTIEDVRAVILYGSFARKEATSRSDIDLFILTTEKKTEKDVEDKIIRIESAVGRNIQPTIRTLKELKKTDSGLLQNIFQEGKVLYLKEPTDIPSLMLLEQKPQLIYSFQLRNLNQNEKAKFNNEFYGRKKEKYSYKGILRELSGQKLSAGCVIVPHAEKQKIEKFFKKFKVKFEQLKVWK